MSQNDYIIANQTAPAFRADLNNALQALASLSSGSSQPATTYANMLWYDTGTNMLKMRTEADDAWITIGYFDQTSNAFRIIDDTQVVNTSGTQTGLIGGQSTSTWETGTGTTESLVSPANVKSAIDSLVPDNAIGVSQSWSSVSRSTGTAYQNTTGKPIMASHLGNTNNGIEVSTDNSTWVTASGNGNNNFLGNQSIIVPNGHYYRYNNSYGSKYELR